MNKGGVFVISGPSGTGKDTLLTKFFAAHPNIKFSISSITRPMREGEKEGEKYNFISREKFEQMLNDDLLLEHNVYAGNYYGTPKLPVIAASEHGDDMIIEVDVNGAAQIREKLPEAVFIFIMPPSYKELKRRLIGRGTETEEAINKRLEIAISEIERADEFDFIVINDNLEIAVEDLKNIITNSRLYINRQKYIIDEVLKDAKP